MEEEETEKTIEPTCQSCGLRIYNDFCPVCQLSVKKTQKLEEEEEDETDWREKKR